MITKYGYGTIGVVSILVFLLITASIFAGHPAVKYLLAGLGIALMIFTLNFFRDPERATPTGDETIVSPADGKVLLIKEVEEPRFLKGKGTQVSVFMSPLNVHVNRNPITGTVDYLEYYKGKYLVAFDDKASEENERSIIGLSGKYGKVLFTQVAGFVARRIVYDLRLGDRVTKGERFGMIRFGSRVDVIVPEGWSVNVAVNDVVRAGETVLFTRNPDAR